MPMLKTYEAATFCLPQCHPHTFLLLIHAFSSLSHQSMPQRKHSPANKERARKP